VIAFSIVLRLALAFVLPHPRPYIADEFSYLLGGETLAAGRLTNPQHPMWRFFESPHILVHPVYASKYPPAQAVFIAIGDKLFGDPAAGVLFSVALFAGAVCWALEAIVPRRWAVLGGLLTALCFGPGHYWTESYWGGAVAALGAALVIGACARILVQAKGLLHNGSSEPQDVWSERLAGACAFGLGALLLLNSRPFEGGVLVVCAALAMRPRRAVIAALAVVALVMAFYNWRVTGDPLQMPYSLYQAQYGPAPTIWLAGARLASSYGHPELQRLFQHFLNELQNVLAYPLPKRIGVLLVRLIGVLIFGVGPLAFLPLIFAPAFLRDRPVRVLTGLALAVTAFTLLDVSMFPHYAAPLIAVLIVLSFVVLHRMSAMKSGALLSGIMLALMFGGAAVRIGQAAVGRNINYPARPPFRLDREAIAARVCREPGRNVIFVRYAPTHDINAEWVYNAAEIDASRVVWAHDLGNEANRQLLAWYKGRRFWLLQPDGSAPVLQPYGE